MLDRCAEDQEREEDEGAESQEATPRSMRRKRSRPSRLSRQWWKRKREAETDMDVQQRGPAESPEAQSSRKRRHDNSTSGKCTSSFQTFLYYDNQVARKL